MAQRLRDINPAVDLRVLQHFLTPESTQQLLTLEFDHEHWRPKFDYVVDCIDSVAPKQMLIKAAHLAGIKVVTSMGAGASAQPWWAGGCVSLEWGWCSLNTKGWLTAWRLSTNG